MTLKPRSLPHAQLSFSMSGEDLALAHLFKHRITRNEPGFYVDVGCAWPVQISNTYLFYCLGWTGIGIDLNSFHQDAWREFRPRDKFLVGAVSESENDVTIYAHHENRGMLQISEAPPSSDFFLAGTVKPLTLSEILSANADNKTIDLLSIDVEGSELVVLKSNDWGRWKPAVIIMESWDYSPNASQEPASIKFLRELGYEISACVGENVILVLPDRIPKA